MSILEWFRSFLEPNKRGGIIIGLGISIFLLGLTPLLANTNFFIRHNEIEDILEFNKTGWIAPFTGIDGGKKYNYFIIVREVDFPCISLMDVKFKRKGYATFKNSYCKGDYLELDDHSLYIDNIISGINGYEINVKLYNKIKVDYPFILIIMGLIIIALGNIVDKRKTKKNIKNKDKDNVINIKKLFKQKSGKNSTNIQGEDVDVKISKNEK